METCEKPVKSKALCSTHYARLLRTGTTDLLRPQGGQVNPWFGQPVKKCNKCGEIKDRTEANWSKKSASADGLESTCRPCLTQRQRDLWVEKPEHMKSLELNRRLKKFGLTREQYDTLLSEQDGLCAICHREPNGIGGLHIDHDHATGKARGLLCHSCNVSLGHFGDDVALLLSAVDYLRKHSAQKVDA